MSRAFYVAETSLIRTKKDIHIQLNNGRGNLDDNDNVLHTMIMKAFSCISHPAR
ncbi:MAG: hypothetical protein LBB76_05395 [Azoarcus sp.]|nr:hypothetical protein [Azoarcus sp.]